MTRSPDISADPVLRLRNRVLVSDVLAVAATCLVAAVHHPHWRWSLVVWGLVIGLSAQAMTELMNFVVLRRMDVPSSRREMLRRRRPIFVANAITVGLLLGIYSAVLDTGAVDILGVVIFVVTWLVGAALTLRVLRRRRRAAQD